MKIASGLPGGIFDIYAPLAHRLGIGQIRWELEDLAFRYLHASEYKTIAQQLAEKRQEREHYISDLVSDLKAQLETVGLNPDISWRAKHIFSIWRKMQRKNIDFAEVFDVRAVRLLVQEPRLLCSIGYGARRLQTGSWRV